MTKKTVPLEVDPSIMEKKMKIITQSPMEEEFNKLLATVEPRPYKQVKPTPGCCVKTYSKPDDKKVFINICLTDAIPSPPDISHTELMQILNSPDPSSYRVPMSLGEGRTELDKSNNATTVYDVAVNPNFFKEKIEQDDLFKTFFLTVVYEGLQDKYQCELDMNRYVVLKNRKSVGILQYHRIQIRDVKNCENAMKPPMIEELNGNKPAKIQEICTAPKEMVYRLRREPPTGEIDYLLAEFKIPASVDLHSVSLEVGEDRLALGTQGALQSVDIFLPCSVDQDMIQAQLNRNTNMLTVKMPVVQ